ncbi:hypothetical protein EJA71_03505 [Pseudomonas sp. PB106]|nr:hypothetical protein EJA71_03505 [Pseudomonas sp. PB106]
MPAEPDRKFLIPDMIVPTLCVGMPQGTLRVPACERDAERPGLHSHAERGNDHHRFLCWMIKLGSWLAVRRGHLGRSR